MVNRRFAKKLVWLLMISCALLVMFYQFNRVDQLKKHGQLIDGFVYDYYPGTFKSPGVKFKYFFVVNGDMFHATSTSYRYFKESSIDEIINKTFPVLVDTANITNSILLLSPKMFDKYEVPFPDSLQWLVRYF